MANASTTGFGLRAVMNVGNTPATSGQSEYLIQTAPGVATNKGDPMSFNDGAALTCLGNDLGYENVFSEQIKLHAKEDDLVVAISSSGSSPNILRAVAAANNCGCTLLTLSGFSSENPLRTMGALNWYVDSNEYGFVEISHLTICHMILDIEMGSGQFIKINNHGNKDDD